MGDGLLKLSHGILLLILMSRGIETTFQVMRTPCLAGTLSFPDNCRTCICDMFGSQLFCTSFCTLTNLPGPKFMGPTRQQTKTTKSPASIPSSPIPTKRIKKVAPLVIISGSGSNSSKVQRKRISKEGSTPLPSMTPE